MVTILVSTAVILKILNPAQATQDVGPQARDEILGQAIDAHRPERFEELLTEFDLLGAVDGDLPQPAGADDGQTLASLDDGGQPDDTQPEPGAAAPDDTQPCQDDVATPGDHGHQFEAPVLDAGQAEDGQPQGAGHNDSQPPRRKRFLRDMTEEEKAVEMERRKQKARENSKVWHEKWVSKGVLKAPAGSRDGEGDAREKPDHELPPEEPPKDDDPGDENQPDVTVFVPDKDLLDAAISGDLRKTRMMYMNAWADWKTKQPGSANTTTRKDLMDQANKEWLGSELRAQCQAARSNKVYWEANF